MKQLTNTELFCIRALQHYGHIGPLFIVKLRWPDSKQTDKKSRTVRRHLERLSRAGYVRSFGPFHFMLTAAGESLNVTQRDRPNRMRIAQ